MKKTIWLIFLLASLLFACATAAGETAPAATEEPEAEEFSIDDLYLTTVFPAGWTVVTPDTVEDYMRYFEMNTPENAAALMRAEGVYAVAFSPEGDAQLRVLAQRGDEAAALYFDIERYTPAMRTEIRAGFLNKEAWALTGYRYTEAEWTNKSTQGRQLRLTYSIRSGEETVARGFQAYTIRNGMAFTLDLKVEGRKPTTAEQRVFEDFISATIYPASLDMPLLPVGLAVTGTLPEETYTADLIVKGETMKAANIAAWLLPTDEEAIRLNETVATSSGAFTLELTLPGEGEYRLYLVASLDGFADSEIGSWISYSKRRIPVTFTEVPDGVYQASQIIVSGKTIPGVTIQCMEGETNKKTVTGSGGEFSFKMDRTITGPRTIVLSMTKKGFDNRRFDIVFDRQWKMDDYIRYLADKVQNLSYKNLSTRGGDFVGRLVKYTGRVMELSAAGGRTYVQFALTQTKTGVWTDQIVAFTDGMEMTLAEGDAATLYVEVTGEAFTFSDVDADGNDVETDLPVVKLIAYLKN